MNAIVSVSTVDELYDALYTWVEGEVIELAAGDYGTLTIPAAADGSPLLPSGLVLMSADPTDPAMFSGLNLTAVTGLTLSAIGFTADTTPADFHIVHSDAIVIEQPVMPDPSVLDHLHSFDAVTIDTSEAPTDDARLVSLETANEPALVHESANEELQDAPLAQTFMSSTIVHEASGVTYHFSEDVEYGYYWNGDIFVVSHGRDVEITRITPDSMALDTGRIVNGAVVDPSIANSQEARNGFDSGIAYNSYDAASNEDPGMTGRNLVISHAAHPEGVSIVKVVSNETFTDARHATYDNSVLTIVNEVPPAGAFRPAVAAANKDSTFTIDDLDFSILQSVETVEGQRPISDFEDLQHATVASWITQGSSSRGHYPSRYFDDYGDYRMEELADGFMALHSSYSNEEKADLYAAFVQIGLDYAGAVESGKTFTSGGGGLNNYVKPFVVLAAGALKDEGLAETAGFQPDVYGEDQQFFYVSEAHTNYESFNWGANKRPAFLEQYTDEQIGLPEWGVFTLDDRNSSLINGNSYRSINSDTMVQVALVTEMLGENAANIWGNQAYFDYADRAHDIYRDRLPASWQSFYERYHDTYKTSSDWEGAPETILKIDLREAHDGIFVQIATPDDGVGLPVLRTDLRYSTDGQTWTVLTDVGAETTLTDVPADTFLYVQARHVNEIGSGRWSLNNFTTTNDSIHKTLQSLDFEDVPETYNTDYGLGRKEYALLSTSYQDHLRDLIDGIEEPRIGTAVQGLMLGTIQTVPENERDQLRDPRSVLTETFETEETSIFPVEPVENGLALRMEGAGVRASFDWPAELQGSDGMTLSFDFKLDSNTTGGQTQTLLYWSGVTVLRIDHEVGSLSGVTGLDIEKDIWHQVVLTKDMSTGLSNLYFDGTLVHQASEEPGGELNLSTHQIHLGDPFAFGSEGQVKTGRGNIEGFIDNLEIFDAALSAEEIAVRFNEKISDAPEPEPSPEPDVNDGPTGAVTIVGTPAQGETVAADTSALADADGLGTLSYVWLRDGVAIAGATGESYTLTLDDVGAQIGVVVSYTDGGGTVESVASAVTEPVTGLEPEPEVEPGTDPGLDLDEVRLDGAGVAATVERLEVAGLLGAEAFEMSFTLGAAAPESVGELFRLPGSFVARVDEMGEFRFKAFLEDGSTVDLVTTLASLNDMQLHQIDIRYEAGRLEVWVDDRLAGAEAMPAPLADTGERDMIFGNPNNPNFEGIVSGFEIAAEATGDMAYRDIAAMTEAFAPEDLVLLDPFAGFVANDGGIPIVLPKSESITEEGIALETYGTAYTIARDQMEGVLGAEEFRIDFTLDAASAASAGDLFRVHHCFFASVNRRGDLVFVAVTEDGDRVKLYTQGENLNDMSHHDVSIRYKDGQLDIWVDGSLAASAEMPAPLALGKSSPLYFGNESGKQNFAGHLSDFELSLDAEDNEPSSFLVTADHLVPLS